MSALSHQVLLPETYKILEDLEGLSGFPVSFLEDPTLSVLATIRTGTPSSPVHIIRYRPGKEAPDYKIAIEAGYALRMFARPLEKRFHLSGNERYRAEAIAEVQRLDPSLEDSAAEAMGKHIFDGLLLQLRSCPVGLLVDIWIYKNHPGLRSLQAASLREQIGENTQCLSKELEKRFPRLIVNGNRAMNAAQTLFVADLLNEPHLVVPYRAAGFVSIATDLLSSVTARPFDEIDDMILISTWADSLGIRDWIKWLPFN